MINSIFLLAALSNLDNVAGCTPDVVFQVRAASAFQEAVLLPAPAFSPSHIIDLSKSFLRAHLRETILRYVIFTSRSDVGSYLGGRGTTDWDFPKWREAYMAESGSPPAIAEMIRLGDRASVRIREQDGKITEHVLQSASPFRVDIVGRKAQILSVTFQKAGHVSRHEPLGRPDYVVSFALQMSEPWDAETAAYVSRVLRRDLRFPWLRIAMEDGWWFSWDQEYPVYNRFLPRKEPPSYSEFRGHTRYYCAPDTPACFRFGPAK